MELLIQNIQSITDVVLLANLAKRLGCTVEITGQTEEESTFLTRIQKHKKQGALSSDDILKALDHGSDKY